MIYDDKQIRSYFDALWKECNKSDAYSVAEIAQKVGVNYNDIQVWAKNDKQFSYMLEICRGKCFFHAEIATITGILEHEKGVRYCVESADESDELRECYVEELKRIEKEKLQNAKEALVLRQEKEMPITDTKMAHGL